MSLVPSALTAGTWLVTGGCGFIGAEFIRQSLAECPDVHIVNLDALSYAASPERLSTVADHPRYHFIRGDIAEPDQVAKAIQLGVQTGGPCRAIVNFAAESHVDRSLFTGVPFVRANTLGVQVLLEAARDCQIGRFLQVSTDEVYGDVPAPHRSIETDRPSDQLKLID